MPDGGVDGAVLLGFRDVTVRITISRIITILCVTVRTRIEIEIVTACTPTAVQLVLVPHLNHSVLVWLTTPSGPRPIRPVSVVYYPTNNYSRAH